MNTLLQDLKYGLRLLRRNPVFTIVAVLTLALGIGANTAIFSVVNGVLLRALPYPDSDRLVFIWAQTHKDQTSGFSGLGFADFIQQNQSYLGLTCTWGPTSTAGFTGWGEPELIGMQYVSPTLFSVYGIAPLPGRDFTSDDIHIVPADRMADPNAEFPIGAVIISHAFWQKRFGGDREALGRIIQINGRPQELIGVMPPDFKAHLPSGLSAVPELDAWIIPNWDPLLFPRDAHFLYVTGRLKPGVTIEQAQIEADASAQRQSDLHGERQG